MECLDRLANAITQSPSIEGRPAAEGPVLRLTVCEDVLGGRSSTEAIDSLTLFAGELIERGVPFDFEWNVDAKVVLGHHRFGCDGVSRHLMGGSVPTLAPQAGAASAVLRGQHFSMLPPMLVDAAPASASTPTPPQPQTAGGFFARARQSRQQPVTLPVRAKIVAAAVLCEDPRVSLIDLSALVDEIPKLAGDEAAYVVVACTRRHRARQNIERLSELGFSLTSDDVECALRWLYEFPPPQSCLLVVRELYERLAAHETAMQAMRFGPGGRRGEPAVAATPLATSLRSNDDAQTRRR